MKFYSYLNESHGLNKSAFEKMVKDCKPFLRELKKSNYEFLYSGRISAYEKFNKKKIRKRRKPRDTSIEVHNMLNKAFKERFGVKARSEGFFITNNPHDVTKYGEPHYVFPVGNYKLIYSYNVMDLYMHLKHEYAREFGERIEYFLTIFRTTSPDAEINGYTESEWRKETKRFIDNIVKTYKQSKKIPTSLESGYEIMLIADEVRLQKWDRNDRDSIEPLLKEWIDNAV